MKKLLLILLFLPLIGFSQEKISFENLTDSSGIMYYKGQLFTGKSFYQNHTNQLIAEFNYNLGVLNGKMQVWYENGQLEGEWNYKKGNINGEVKEWYESGKLRRSGEVIMIKQRVIMGGGKTWYENGQLQKEEKWEDGELIYEKCFNKKGKEIDCSENESMDNSEEAIEEEEIIE